MIKNILIYIGLGCCFYVALPVMGSNNTDDEPVLLKNTIESYFSVSKNKITPHKGDVEMCKADNEYMLSAFETKNILLKNKKYEVCVSSKVYLNTSESELKLFHYEVEIDDIDSDMKNTFSAIEKQDFVPAYIPLSKAPTKCYVFIANSKLNMMCHYGLKKHTKMVKIINSIKHERMGKNGIGDKL